MPRPAAQRSRGRSTQSKFLADASSLVSVVTSLQGQRGNSILDGKPVQQAILSFCLSLQALYPQNHASALPLLPEQAKEVVNQVIAIDLLPTLLVLLRSVTPSVLKRSGGNATGCSDPSCNDGACEPPEISSVLFMVSLTDEPTAWYQCGSAKFQPSSHSSSSAGIQHDDQPNPVMWGYRDPRHGLP